MERVGLSLMQGIGSTILRLMVSGLGNNIKNPLFSGLGFGKAEFLPAMLIAFHKPYGVLSQFTTDGSANVPLSDFGLPAGVWPVGRLDADSEGLLILTDEKKLIHRLLDPGLGHPRTYHVEVERVPSMEALEKLRTGVMIGGKQTLPCDAVSIENPGWPERVVPVRFRKNVPTAWLEIVLREGRNRQVRKMTASVGHPTLRLLRVGVGRFRMRRFQPGTSHELDREERSLLLQEISEH